MGEPGTKELLSLEELEATAGYRTGRKHILSILVENKPGVLTRVARLFALRGAKSSGLRGKTRGGYPRAARPCPPAAASTSTRWWSARPTIPRCRASR